MVKIDAEAFKNKFEKHLSEMMCSQSLKHKDVLPEFSGLFWTFFYDLYAVFFLAFHVKALSFKFILVSSPIFS